MPQDPPTDALRSARLELLAKQELYSRIMEAMPGGIVHIDRDGAIISANDEALRFLGMSYDEAAERYVNDWDGQTIWEDGSPCPASAYPVSQCLATGEHQPPITIGIRHPDGPVSWGLFSAAPLADPASGETSGTVATFLDITDRKQAELEREELHARLMITDRMASLGTLTAGVGHEINNPLTYVMANLQRVARQLAEDEALDKEALRQRILDASEGARRIRDIVRDLSTFSREERDDSEPVDIVRTLESSLRMARNEIRLRAQLVRSYEEVPLVRASRSKLGQVFVNLLVNAAQAIGEGAAESHEIEVGVAPDRGGVAVSVRDTGVGIAPELLDRIFDPFVTTKAGGQASETGTGIGLYICHNILMTIGGQIRVDSAPGAGTTFTVWLPACAASEAVARTPTPQPGDLSATRILIVDDEPAIRELLGTELAKHNPSLAASGREALALLETTEFDVILCDLLMPDITGMELFETIEEARPELTSRFVFMTGGAFTDRAREFLARVPNRRIYKPFDGAVVRAVLARVAAQS